MGRWFTETVVDNGRLPLFFLLVSFVLAFLFIRFSVRMIRAEVSWWPGNVTPGGMHIHHVMFGLVMVLISGFALVAIANYETPVANCLLASVFGIGSALMLDEFALILHLRDVYWAEEGRSSIDAVFVAVAITGLYLLGIHPIGFAGDFDAYQQDRSLGTLALVLGGLALQLLLAAVTLLKGKLWTGLIGLFFVPLLIIGASRLGRPRSPWARWRYADKPAKQARAFTREKRFREPAVRAKIVVQEALSGRFGVPIPVPVVTDVDEPAFAPSHAKLPNRLLSAIRWNRTRRRLRHAPVWRLPAFLVTCSIVFAFVLVEVEGALEASDGVTVEADIDVSATATLLAVIAGGMITLTGLVFTAITLAMQFGASQISVRVVPMLQQEAIMRWSIGMFLSTFVFAVIIASDLALAGENTSPVLATWIAVLLAFISAFLFIALVARVGMVLNSSRLLRWIAAQGRTSIVRLYPGFDPDAEVEELLPTPVPATQKLLAPDPLGSAMTVRLTQLSPDGRILLAVDAARIQRLATKWGVTVEVMPTIGEFVAQHAVLFQVDGPQLRVRAHQLIAALVFGDTHSPAVSPVAAIQAIVDIALKALSPAINDPGRAVQAIDHVEDLLMTIAPRVRLETADSGSSARSAGSASSTLTRLRGTRRTWTDYVTIATDEIRHFSTGSTQVQRRLRSLFLTLIDACPPDQHPPLTARLGALDAQVAREWTSELDIGLASVADPQGLGSERGSSGRVVPLVLGKPE
ncbi:DUF2254 family protein [Rhodococcus sp. G-MC3]|uniref:DUF2254 domain-containing protein n=1 Tax=Rhodococcus sp. G-MC3 TaxID=3046209 RepID=UPI0024BB583A|nr:DUF2254 family protein [Rhodococcus sp. G-MC3]MDJ0394631.1 DUF2254 family protein [Rhodococcus sp. G-MC3]